MASTIDLRTVPAPLRDRYRSDPASALVVTAAHSAATDLADPRHCAVTPTAFPGVTIRSGLYPAAGGAGDTPRPGALLATAPAISRQGTPPHRAAATRRPPQPRP